MKVYLTCPLRGHLVQVDFRHERSGRIAKVESCSVFCPETEVDCESLCATLLNEKIERQLEAEDKVDSER